MGGPSGPPVSFFFSYHSSEPLVTVSSDFIYYPSGIEGVGPSYDLRYVVTATRVGATAEIRLLGMVNQIVVFPDWDDFFRDWDRVLNPSPHEGFNVLDPTASFYEPFDVVRAAGGFEPYEVLI